MRLMNVVIYSHVSSQTARQSTERQVADLRKFAEDRCYTVCAVFEEKMKKLDRSIITSVSELLHRFAEPGGYVARY